MKILSERPRVNKNLFALRPFSGGREEFCLRYEFHLATEELLQVLLHPVKDSGEMACRFYDGRSLHGGIGEDDDIHIAVEHLLATSVRTKEPSLLDNRLALEIV